MSVARTVLESKNATIDGKSATARCGNTERSLAHLSDSTGRQVGMSMPSERWLPIPGYEGRYDVSDQGRVRSWLRWSQQPDVALPRILRQAANHRDGHVAVALFVNGRARTFPVHRLVLLAFVGPLPSGMETRHLDGDPTNNYLSNLVYGTHAENKLDRARHGTDHQLNKTHCKRGHPFDAQNTRWLRGGRARHCRRCEQIRDRRKYLAKRRAA